MCRPVTGSLQYASLSRYEIACPRCRAFFSCFVFLLSVLAYVYFEAALIGVVNTAIANLVGCLLTCLSIHLHLIMRAFTHERATSFLLVPVHGGFPPSVDALKRVAVELGSELVPILSLEMAAGDV